MGLPIAINICGAGNVIQDSYTRHYNRSDVQRVSCHNIEYYRGGHASISKMPARLSLTLIPGAVAAGIAISVNITVPKSIDRVAPFSI